MPATGNWSSIDSSTDKKMLWSHKVGQGGFTNLRLLLYISHSALGSLTICYVHSLQCAHSLTKTSYLFPLPLSLSMTVLLCRGFSPTLFAALHVSLPLSMLLSAYLSPQLPFTVDLSYSPCNCPIHSLHASFLSWPLDLL